MFARLRALLRGLALVLLVVAAPAASVWAGSALALLDDDAVGADDAAVADVALDDTDSDGDEGGAELTALADTEVDALGANDLVGVACAHGAGRHLVHAQRGVARVIDPPPRA